MPLGHLLLTFISSLYEAHSWTSRKNHLDDRGPGANGAYGNELMQLLRLSFDFLVDIIVHIDYSAEMHCALFFSIAKRFNDNQIVIFSKTALFASAFIDKVKSHKKLISVEFLCWA